MTPHGYVSALEPRFQLLPDNIAKKHAVSSILAPLLGLQNSESDSILAQKLQPNKPAYSEFQSFTDDQGLEIAQSYVPSHPQEEYSSAGVKTRQTALQTANDYISYGGDEMSNYGPISQSFKQLYGRRIGNQQRQYGGGRKKKPAYLPAQLKKRRLKKKKKGEHCPLNKDQFRLLA